MNIRPLGDRIVIRREEAEDKSAGGIVLPEILSRDAVLSAIDAASVDKRGAPVETGAGATR